MNSVPVLKFYVSFLMNFSRFKPKFMPLGSSNVKFTDEERRLFYKNFRTVSSWFTQHIFKCWFKEFILLSQFTLHLEVQMKARLVKVQTHFDLQEVCRKFSSIHFHNMSKWFKHRLICKQIHTSKLALF